MVFPKKTLRRRTTRRRLIGGAVLTAVLAAVGLAGGAPCRADYTMTPDPTVNWGTWEGWGCSLAWWANVFGTRNDMADLLFTTNSSVTCGWNGATLPALGFQIARYNLGGCGSGMTVNNLTPFKQIAGYWLDWNSSDPASSSFNWYVDSNQRNMLWKARDRGANKFEMFSNSPIWWMCYNHCPAGANGSGAENLQSWNYQQFAVYIATVAKYAHDSWGVNFTSVEAFNEPAAGWWNYDGGQEGCNIYSATQSSVLGYLRTELNNRGLSGVAVSASDENSPDQALSTWNAFSSTTRGKVSRVNTHGYSGLSPYRGSNRGPLYNAVSGAGKGLWMSEYGDTDASGMTMADSIARDLWEMHPTGWVYWQPFDSGAWGLNQCNPGDNWIGPANMKWYVMAQYSRHIRQGMQILKSGDHNTVAAYDVTNHKLVFVTVNFGTAQWINYDLSRYTTVSGPITRWATNTGGGGDTHTSHNDTNLSGKVFWSWFPANTVQTFEVQGVYR